MKNVLIPYKLFYSLIRYHIFEDASCTEEIKKELEMKVNALAAHELYSEYKKAPTEEEKERARKEYLDQKEIPENFRW